VVWIHSADRGWHQQVSGSQPFQFDHAFDESATTDEVYKHNDHANFLDSLSALTGGRAMLLPTPKLALQTHTGQNVFNRLSARTLFCCPKAVF
jgi:hypothetical protein